MKKILTLFSVFSTLTTSSSITISCKRIEPPTPASNFGSNFVDTSLKPEESISFDLKAPKPLKNTYIAVDLSESDIVSATLNKNKDEDGSGEFKLTIETLSDSGETYVKVNYGKKWARIKVSIDSVKLSLFTEEERKLTVSEYSEQKAIDAALNTINKKFNKNLTESDFKFSYRKSTSFMEDYKYTLNVEPSETSEYIYDEVLFYIFLEKN